MSIPKKGSRTLVVDGTPYRWLVRKRPTYTQALAQSPLSFAVELVQGGRSSLVVNTTSPRPDAWVGGSSIPVTPAAVANAIRRALQLGWQPKKVGSPFILPSFVIET